MEILKKYWWAFLGVFVAWKYFGTTERRVKTKRSYKKLKSGGLSRIDRRLRLMALRIGKGRYTYSSDLRRGKRNMFSKRRKKNYSFSTYR